MTALEKPIIWPEKKSFAFTIFDDPDGQPTAVGREVYAFLRDLGFRTTKGVWPLRGEPPPSCSGGCCEEAEYLDWCLALQREGFEIGFHNATQNTAQRLVTQQGIERFEEMFGHPPVTMANHYNSSEGLYWGDNRLSGIRRALYNVVTRFGNHARFFGHVEGHPLYWGDLCRDRVTYVRNFVFRDINTLKACPMMPYFDSERPLVRNWYASSEGANRDRFVETIAEANQDRLALEGGACIMYTHFGHGYVREGKLDNRFCELMVRLRALDGWFVPVGTLLDHLRAHRGTHLLTAQERARLEWRWLLTKIRHGTS